MSDQLKSFIDNHREAFDAESLPEGLWSKIEAELPPPPVRERRMHRLSTWRLAAAASVLLCLGFGAGWWWTQTNRAGYAGAHPQELPLPPGFEETQAFYQRKIDQCRVQLVRHPESQKVLLDLAAMEADYRQLEQDLAQSPEPERVVAAMIQNCQKRLQMLEWVLQKLEEGKGRATTPQGTSL